MHNTTVIAVFLSLAILGFIAVDPIGIAVTLIILVQKKPIARSMSFIAGSFSILIILGYLISRYLGKYVYRLTTKDHWVITIIESISGLILLLISLYLYIKSKTTNYKKLYSPSLALTNQINLGYIHLFFIGVAVVSVQSLADVVFILAMTKLGSLKLSTINLSIALLIYAISSLLIQCLIVFAFLITPRKNKNKVLIKVNTLLEKYANKLIIGISFILGLILLFIAFA